MRRREADPDAEGCNSTRMVAGRNEDRVREGSTSNDVDGEIYTVNLDGTGLTQVTHAPGANSPDWGTHPVTP